MIINALQDKPLPVYGDGLNVRDWIHVDDHCAAIFAALLDGKPGEVYNVGSDGETEKYRRGAAHPGRGSASRRS